ncbi:hypothetical protein SPRG_19961 [Saprolegnia parasitica CBS 223.65]|uniref:Mediator of RNA polymerase II transcription subunit 18 n=1 Tax=Saprolegnia parasitica (strain CBS 223.65) TaxID=695850 RepID=A0A067CPM7_SAPPC|nr:hypothetical protein SPRG_19961 [Saprolegnia parasitica CBS 223.65]KDO28747.1 hypothetical protein SPRG_19961 [Saprolegnia parasitica CBS 223.65]|eukprot:XP_012200494.1 hypothetical protein SPRG_19961 [Saprolegnia parasitica CBS 223.65]
MSAVSNKSFEVNLQGEVPYKDYTAFEERIRGLCGDDTEKEQFSFKEYVYNFDAQSPQGVPNYEVRARHVIYGSCTYTGAAVEATSKGSQKWELRYIGKWERKKPTDQTGRAAQSVAYRSQVAVSASDNVRTFLSTLGFRHSFRYMRSGTRWNFPNGIMVEATRMKPLEKDEQDDFPLENMQVDALLVEVSALTTDDKIEEVAQKIRRLAIDLDPYFIERPVEGKEVSHHTAILAGEMRNMKKQKVRR